MTQLDRFKRAQDERYAGFESALEEIQSGRKRGHWIWYVFPQLDGLGMSSMARAYGIEGEGEATEYLHDPLLRERLLIITRAVAAQLTASDGKTLRLSTLMGSEIDAKKLVSSLTLFAEVARRHADAALAGAADEVLAIASAQGYPACAFTRRTLGMTA